MQAYVKIKKSRSKKNPFAVTHIGKNGEPLGNPELLSTKKNVTKNLLAYLNLFTGERVFVVDETVPSVKKYVLHRDGTEEMPE